MIPIREIWTLTSAINLPEHHGGGEESPLCTRHRVGKKQQKKGRVSPKKGSQKVGGGGRDSTNIEIPYRKYTTTGTISSAAEKQNPLGNACSLGSNSKYTSLPGGSVRQVSTLTNIYRIIPTTKAYRQDPTVTPYSITLNTLTYRQVYVVTKYSTSPNTIAYRQLL